MNELLSVTVGEVIESIAKEYPDRYAVRYTDRDFKLTWKEFDAKISAIAKGFIAHGIKKGDKVAVWATNTPEWMLSFYASARIGAILVTVNTAYKMFELEYLLKQSDTKMLVMMDSYKGNDYIEIINSVCPGIKKKTAPLSPMLPYLEEIVYSGPGECPAGLTPWSSIEEDG